MPATFPSHAAVVLPVKLAWPRRFDGVALVVGSAAPDMYYALNGYVVVPPTHNLPGLFWFALPVTLLATFLIRRSAPTIAVHLPARPGWLALRDYGVLGQVRHRWYVTVYSALLGSASHVLWDGFTHHPQIAHGFGVRWVPALTAEAWPGVPWWLLAQHASTVLGAIAALGMAVYLGRRRLLRRWHGEPPPAPYAPWAFWSAAGAVVALYPLTWPLLRFQYATYVQGVRMLLAFGFALLAGAVAARLFARRQVERAG
ncbi:DUF4184 family protein [Natronosporangium hydrolyticum]|uniref:DUF4184 family protein n=1 Tax=Natronosporangium hydrolyticum TaxID=2811111 RepID=A0A895YHG1_9ACTN|nr:DUF4184 family protein [Natronosporangium hydrolyticum]QSB14949.1 DUF4184 family protein [Natronosporangium hydrolyticum]